jgi:hypothetical protein
MYGLHNNMSKVLVSNRKSPFVDFRTFWKTTDQANNDWFQLMNIKKMNYNNWCIFLTFCILVALALVCKDSISLLSDWKTNEQWINFKISKNLPPSVSFAEPYIYASSAHKSLLWIDYFFHLFILFSLNESVKFLAWLQIAI